MPGLGRVSEVVVDCADPRGLAGFWSAVLGRPVAEDDECWASLAPDATGATLAFQRVDGHRAPRWPGRRVPQQLHLDVLVDDLDRGHDEVVRLGAAVLTDVQPGEGKPWRVYADPAGHPFCLVTG